MELNGQGYKKPDQSSGMYEPPLAGRYHARVKAADDSGTNPKYPGKIMVEFEVLAGTTPNQEGKTISLFVDTTRARNIERLVHLAIVLGLMKPNEKKDVQFIEALGRDCVIEAQDNEYTDKTGVQRKTRQIAWVGFWPVDDPDVADVPKNAAPANGTATPTQAAAPATKALWDNI